MIEEYDVIGLRKDIRKERMTQTEKYNKRYKRPKESKKDEEFNFSEEEILAVKKLERCPFCHKNNVNIKFGFYVNRPNKRYSITHHCSAIRCTIETECFEYINDLIERWNGEYKPEEKKNF